ncbi:MAG: pseudouridine-5'-phosphate glycosidase [Acidimicrobiia bacterium]|nr:MAG: pseudouridine-5'-phosphate glycosidase [Acidimicrobiia bacterium]
MADMIVSAPVRDALDAGRPVVALESTIFSNLGLPSPANEEALTRTLAAVSNVGAVPAVTAVMDGAVRVGLEADAYERILGPATKTAERDIAAAVSQRWPVGATTVSASLAIAARAGITVFATGGIGGVHHRSSETGDVSADLGAIARHRVLTVSAGAKAFLDIPRTLEHLEMLSVPVVGYRTDDFPMFYARSSGLPVPLRLDSVEEVADLLTARFAWGEGGVLLAVPVPQEAALPSSDIQGAMNDALELVEVNGITGAAVTPFVLGEISKALDGRNIPANLALSENNAQVAAQVAVALTSRS